jgi:hypothetical protein
MTDVTELEEVNMASQNHAITQLQLGAQLLGLGDSYKGATELSLDMGTPERQEIVKKHGLEVKELKPDLVLYHAKDFGFIKAIRGMDKIRVTEVPLLCIEIISPTQISQDILNKFKVYFEIGVKSCWYVDPTLETVHVYAQTFEHEVYHNGDLVDQTLDIKIPLNKVFY